ncbi:hypothetical protein Droror1_Dr00025234 [Drosera rotundifolia]
MWLMQSKKSLSSVAARSGFRGGVLVTKCSASKEQPKSAKKDIKELLRTQFCHPILSLLTASSAHHSPCLNLFLCRAEHLIHCLLLSLSYTAFSSHTHSQTSLSNPNLSHTNPLNQSSPPPSEEKKRSESVIGGENQIRCSRGSLRSTNSPRATQKSLRATTPTSEQLASLNLKEGKNVVTFTFLTAMLREQQGIQLFRMAMGYGISVWVTFVMSHVLAGVLPRQQFAIVQSKLYPVYFKAMGFRSFPKQIYRYMAEEV